MSGNEYLLYSFGGFGTKNCNIYGKCNYKSFSLIKNFAKQQANLWKER